MHLNLELYGKRYRIATESPMDLSIPLHFNGPQPNTYDVPIATAAAVEAGQFIGDTRRGGSCNFETYTMIPHCNGTHTECIGHLSFERISIHKTLRETLFPAVLTSVQPVQALNSSETYHLRKEESDFLITANALRTALVNADNSFLRALIIRTLPNDSTKMSRRYAEAPAPFFSIEALEFIRSLDVEHLLVDVPSLDRARDEGKLSAHRIFWDMPPMTHDVSLTAHSLRTITEMIYVDDSISDGKYLLNLQIASFVADAAPSRPILYSLQETHD